MYKTMKVYKPIIDYISNYIHLEDSEIETFKSLTGYKKLRKRQFLVEQGEVCRYENFVINGCLRCYYVDREGDEHIIQFAVESWWIADLQSFLTQSPAQFNVDAIEPSELIQIEYQNLQQLYREIPKFERFFRLIIQNAFVASQRRIIASFSRDAESRYLEFKQRYPDIEQRVPQYMIASYLGITPEFLSKIRKRLAEKRRS